MLNYLKRVVSITCLGSCAFACAQTSKGTLVGEVRDPGGAVVTKATVTVKSQETDETRETSTDAAGSFRVEAINPGTYAIHVDAPGFETFDIKGIIVRASVITTYNPVIAVGSVAQTVSVAASTNNVNTDNGQLSATVGSTELNQLPIFSLNPVELTATLPGAQYINPNALGAAGGAYGQYYQVEFNGARPRANNFMLDGQDINDVGLGGQAFQPQIPDMFQSLTALTNSSSAEYGRAGGAVVNLISKGGTNQFHGTAFELYSGSGLNAVDGITRIGSTSRANKARYDQHQFGFTGGGPILKNKLFGFGGVQFTRFYGNSSSGLVEMPDAAGYATLTSIGGPQVALLQSLLSDGSYLSQYQYKASLGVVESFNVGQPTIGNQVCPDSGCVVTTGYYQRPPVPQQEPDTQWLYRIDFIPHEKDTFTFRYLHDRNNFLPDLGLNTSGLPGFDGEVGGPTELASGNWTHVFSPTLLNELRGSETRINFLFQALPSALANPASKIYQVNFADAGIPELGLSQNIPQGTKENGYQFQDTMGWVVGRQSFRFGVDVGRILETDVVAQQAIGELNFTNGGGPSGIGNFLNNNLGASGYATKTFGPTRIDPHTWRTAWFVQDDVKLKPELTINLGLRWDYLTDPGNSLKYPAVNVQDLAAPIDAVFKIHTGTLNFGPRIGFAYSPGGTGFWGGGKSVVHGGFGIYYDTSFSNIATNTAQASPNAPTGTLISTTGAGLGDATSLIATITPDLSPLDSVQSVDKNLVNPRTYQWNLGVERALPAQLKLAVNYVGSRGRKLYANQQYNYFDADTGERLNPDRGAINLRANTAASQYDSLQIDVTRQFAKGLFFRGAYTYGRSFDDGSEVFALTFASPTSYSANLAPGGRGQDWGPSAFDYRQYFTLSYVWTPAGFHSSNHAADLLLGGATRNFTISGVTQLQSGPPGSFNISGIDTNGDGSAFNDRPLLGNRRAALDTAGIDGYWVGGDTGTYYDLAAANSTGDLVPVSPQQVHWLVPVGDASITPFEIGRNSYTNPGSTVWNVSAQKDIPAPWTRLEGARFELRAEAEDVGNHNDVGPLDTNVLHIGSGNTYLNPGNSRVSSARQVRFWAKFSF